MNARCQDSERDGEYVVEPEGLFRVDETWSVGINKGSVEGTEDSAAATLA